MWHEPLPLELAREREPLVKLLGAALSAAGVPTSPGDWGVAARTLVAPRASLVVVVNERPERAVRRVMAAGRAYDVPVAALGTRLVLVERGGRIVTSTPGEAIVPSPLSDAAARPMHAVRVNEAPPLCRPPGSRPRACRVWLLGRDGLRLLRGRRCSLRGPLGVDPSGPLRHRAAARRELERRR